MSQSYEKNRKELIANISHDLKTPITSIRGYVQGIMEGVASTPEKESKYIQTIYSNADMDKIRGLGLGADDYMVKPNPQYLETVWGAGYRFTTG